MMKYKKLLLKLMVGLTIFGLLILPTFASAQGLKNINENLDNTGQKAGVKSDISIVGYLSLIIQALLGLLGLIFLLLIIYSGFQWMTAMGAEEKIAKARKTIVNSTIGLLIVILSYSIAYFVITAIENAAKK
jgi:hypothetical protein